MEKSTQNNNTEIESAIIVGASLSGLMSGIALAREGLKVTILDKVGEEQRTGSGLQVDGGAFDMSKTSRLLRKLASGGERSIQLWSSIESRLRKEALADSRIDVQYSTQVQKVDQDKDSAWIVTDNGETIHCDILIGADGHRSMVRHHVAPHKPNATYAGYIVWVIDTINENEIHEEVRPRFKDNGVTMLNGPHGFLFGNILEDDTTTTGLGNRRIGCAWYDNTKSNLFRRLGCVEGTTVHHTLKGPDIPEETLHELVEQANEMWPEPWLSATLLALKNRALTGIPIKEYLPDNLVKGRIALVGDAAHVPAPITASGFNESLEDAVALGKCVAKGIQGNEALKSMKKYESIRLKKVRRMVQSGQSFGRRFGRP